MAGRKLFDRWFFPRLPEGYPSLEAFEAAITAEELERLPKTLMKLAMDGVERIHKVRGVDLDPDRSALVYLDELLDEELAHKLTHEQDPQSPFNLFRVVCTEFGCIVGEIYVREQKGVWRPQRGPNLWRSRIAAPSGTRYDPFRAVVSKLEKERQPDALVRHFDTFG